MTLEQFKPDMHVRYVPRHANGDLSHPDAEDGIVTSINHRYVFVRFGNKTHGVACDPDDLIPGIPG